MSNEDKLAMERQQIENLRPNDESDTNFLIWAKERDNYVTPLSIVSFQIKSPAKFGWRTAPYAGIEDGLSGQLCKVSLSTVRKFRPNSLEIADVGCPVAEFLSKVDPYGKELFGQVRWLRIYESNCDVDHISSVIENAKSLSALELFESQLSNDERNRILRSLATRTSLKAFDFIYDFGGLELNEWFTHLRMKLRIVRFSGPPGVKYSAVRNVRNTMPVVEFVAVQDLDVDVPPDGPFAKTWHRDFLNRCCHAFPSLKYFYLDYKVIDSIFIYDDDTIRVLEAVRDFFCRMKLVALAILIYCPDGDMKESVAKAAKFFTVDCKIRAEVKEFFRGSADAKDAPSNFALLVLGDHLHTRTVRLVETIVGRRNSTPDLRHFCYVMDLDAFLGPNSTLAFGGFDSSTVEKTYKEKHASFSTAEFAPDSIVERYGSG